MPALHMCLICMYVYVAFFCLYILSYYMYHVCVCNGLDKKKRHLQRHLHMALWPFHGKMDCLAFSHALHKAGFGWLPWAGRRRASSLHEQKGSSEAFVRCYLSGVLGGGHCSVTVILVLPGDHQAGWAYPPSTHYPHHPHPLPHPTTPYLPATPPTHLPTYPTYPPFYHTSLYTQEMTFNIFMHAHTNIKLIIQNKLDKIKSHSHKNYK